jgi:hypothetical protein
MASDFEDILIVGIRDEDEPLERDDRYPGLFQVHFLLSPDPPPGWPEIFEDDRQSNMDSSLRWRAEISGDELVALSPREKVEKVYEQMREHIARSNMRYRQQVDLQHASDADTQAKTEETDRRLREALRKLKFE